MTIRHMDFPSGQNGLYGSNTSLMDDGIWAEIGNGVTLVNDPDPNITGNVLRIQGENLNFPDARFVLPVTNTTVGMGCRVWLNSLPIDAATFVIPHQYRSTTNSDIISIIINTTGRIEARRGDEGGTLLGTSAGPAIVANGWQHIESKVFFSSTLGTVEVRVDGVPVLDLSGVDTTNFLCAQVNSRAERNGIGQFIIYHIKDYVVWDGSGSVNNDFLGSVQIYRLVPTGDVSFNWGTSSGVTGFNLINESPPNDDASYIFASDTLPSASTFDLTDLDPDISSIRAMYVVARSRKTDGGDGNLQLGLKSGATTGLGADRPITTSYTYWRDVFETDPNTGGSWTLAAANAVQLQINRTT